MPHSNYTRPLTVTFLAPCYLAWSAFAADQAQAVTPAARAALPYFPRQVAAGGSTLWAERAMPFSCHKVSYAAASAAVVIALQMFEAYNKHRTIG